MKKFKIDKNMFTLDTWTVETPLPCFKKNYRYHHLSITSEGIFFDGKLIVKGKLKLMKEKREYGENWTEKRRKLNE